MDFEILPELQVRDCGNFGRRTSPSGWNRLFGRFQLPKLSCALVTAKTGGLTRSLQPQWQGRHVQPASPVDRCIPLANRGGTSLSVLLSRNRPDALLLRLVVLNGRDRNVPTPTNWVDIRSDKASQSDNSTTLNFKAEKPPEQDEDKIPPVVGLKFSLETVQIMWWSAVLQLI